MFKGRALVTGSNGFVGTYLTRELINRGYHVYPVDTRTLKGVDALDIFKYDEGKFDLVFHCAYYVGGRAQIESSKTALAKNLQLDSAMFDWAQRTKQPRIIYFSSSSAYPVKLQDGKLKQQLHENFIDLDNMEQPDMDYGWAKLNGERLARNLQQFTNVHIVRPFSGYAEDQSLDYPFPSLVRRAQLKANPFVIWGSTQQVRDWIHIKDIVNAIFAMIDADYQDPVNLCTGIPTTMESLAQLCMNAANYSGTIEGDMSLPMGVMYRVGNPNNMLKFYTPKIPIEESVRRAFND